MSVCFCYVIPLIFDDTGHEQAGNIRSETPLMRPLAGPTKAGINTELVLTATVHMWSYQPTGLNVEQS